MIQQASYKEPWGRYDVLRDLSRKVTHEQLPNLFKSRNGRVISKSEITLDGLDFSTFRILS